MDLVATYWSFGKAADLRQIHLAFHIDARNRESASFKLD